MKWKFLNFNRKTIYRFTNIKNWYIILTLKDMKLWLHYCFPNWSETYWRKWLHDHLHSWFPFSPIFVNLESLMLRASTLRGHSHSQHVQVRTEDHGLIHFTPNFFKFQFLLLDSGFQTPMVQVGFNRRKDVSYVLWGLSGLRYSFTLSSLLFVFLMSLSIMNFHPSSQAPLHRTTYASQLCLYHKLSHNCGLQL